MCDHGACERSCAAGVQGCAGVCWGVQCVCVHRARARVCVCTCTGLPERVAEGLGVRVCVSVCARVLVHVCARAGCRRIRGGCADGSLARCVGLFPMGVFPGVCLSSWVCTTRKPPCVCLHVLRTVLG